MEHVLVAFFAVGFPVLTAPTYSKRRAAILAGDRALKKREYVETICWLSAMGVASVVFFVMSDLDLAHLGVVAPRSLVGAVSVLVAVAGSSVLWLQVRAVRRDPATRDAVRKGLTPVREYVPNNRDEMRLFRGVSVAAGIGEELFYRGFLLWYFVQWMPMWAAVVVSSLLFGLAHVMHGTQATLRSTLTGFFLAGLYLLGGSLVAPMILHTVVDLTSGEMGAIVFGEDSTAAV